MITIQGKEFRNFAEQIYKNKEDIASKSSTPTDPDTPTVTSDLKPYLLLVNFQYGDYDLNTRSGYGYAIVYMSQAEADDRESKQTVPNYIQLTASLVLSTGEAIVTNVYEYQPDNGRLVPPIAGGYNMIIQSVHYQEFTI